MLLAMALVLAPGAPLSRIAFAHPLHTARAELQLEADGTAVLRVRTFSDDFSAAVARATGTTPPSSHQVSDAAAGRYLAATFGLQVGGERVQFQLISQRQEGEVTWVELRGRAPLQSLRGAQLRHAMLMELHADQVNVLTARYSGRSFTTLFSRDARLRTLP